jgi:hypothetical protein
MAAIARKIYLNKNAGVGQLAKVTNSLITCPQLSIQLCYCFERVAQSPSTGIRQQRAEGRQGDHVLRAINPPPITLTSSGAMSMRLKGGPLQRRHKTLCNPPFLNAIVVVPSLDTFAATASTFFFFSSSSSSSSIRLRMRYGRQAPLVKVPEAHVSHTHSAHSAHSSSSSSSRRGDTYVSAAMRCRRLSFAGTRAPSACTLPLLLS